eukprot:10550265-Ditylum_brightwellii.AAC.1
MSECVGCEQTIDLVDNSDNFAIKFSLHTYGRPDLARLIPIVSSVVLAQSMLKQTSGKGPTGGIDGFVVKLNMAGGHNAPPRRIQYDACWNSFWNKDFMRIFAVGIIL